MKAVKLVFCCLVSFVILAQADAQAAATKAAVIFPQLSGPIYAYACTASSCSQSTQLSEYGYITNVPTWSTSSNGPGGAAPATWVFLPLNSSSSGQYFQFWQKQGSEWLSCVLEVTSSGAGSATTCVGVVYAAPPATTLPTGLTGVASFSMGTAMFPTTLSKTGPVNPGNTNTLPARSLTFVNATLYKEICLQTDSSFEHEKCAGAETIAKNSSYVIPSSTLASGSNSGVGQIAATNNAGAWSDTGRGSKGVYATNLEWTIWPQNAGNTGGPTTIDISLVNGFNMGAKLTADKDTVCSISDSEGGAPYFVLYPAGSTMAVFPANASSALSCSTPAADGCYSPCTFSNTPELCCTGKYATPEACTAPPKTGYVSGIGKISTRVYTWAYQDYLGTFTCEANASFTFTLIDPPGQPE